MQQASVRMISWPVAALTTVGVLLLALSSKVAVIVVGCCALAALIGPSYALQALMITTLITYANPAIVKPDAAVSALARLVLVVAVVRVLPMVRGADLRRIWPIWLLGAVCAFTSFMKSPALEISLMKVITFTLAASAVLIAFGRVPPQRLPRLQTWFLTVALTVTALSAVTLLKGSVGIGGDGGLQGLLDQPQALGIFIAPFAAWSVAGVLLMRRQAGRLEVWVALGCIVLIFLTRARTAAFAMTFAVALVMLTRLLARRRAQQAPLGRSLAVAASAAAILLVIAATTGQLGRAISHFAYKDAEQAQKGLGAAFYESRGGGVLAEWHNFLDSPWLGNGFGVYPDGKFPSGVVVFAGIPISAPIEKGFLPTAILEETGLLGTSALVLLILKLARAAWRTPDLRWRAMFIACLGVNIGECVFLSPGGIGLLQWLLMGAAVTAYRASPYVPRAVRALPQELPAARLRMPDGGVLSGSPF
jgi:hypothetical protein